MKIGDINYMTGFLYKYYYISSNYDTDFFIIVNCKACTSAAIQYFFINYFADFPLEKLPFSLCRFSPNTVFTTTSNVGFSIINLNRGFSIK